MFLPLFCFKLTLNTLFFTCSLSISSLYLSLSLSSLYLSLCLSISIPLSVSFISLSLSLSLFRLSLSLCLSISIPLSVSFISLSPPGGKEAFSVPGRGVLSDGVFRDGSSLDLSPSDSSGATYMWDDEDGLEPLGGPLIPCRSYDSDLNSMVSHTDACPLKVMRHGATF